MTKASRQAKKRASATIANRNAGVVLRGFAFRSWNRASCLRRKRISASSAARDKKNSPMNVSNPAFYKDLQTEKDSDRIIAEDSARPTTTPSLLA
jgi:hypothetical protein